MGKAQHVNEQEFGPQVIESEVPVLVDFWAEWCAPCRMIAPIVEDFATEYEGRLKVVKVDVDNNGGIAHTYGIMSIPTLGVFKQGEMIERIVGYMPKQELKKRLDAAIGQRATAG